MEETPKELLKDNTRMSEKLKKRSSTGDKKSILQYEKRAEREKRQNKIENRINNILYVSAIISDLFLNTKINMDLN